MMLAHANAALGRAKRIPSLNEFLGREPEEQSGDEMLAAWDAILGPRPEGEE